MCWGLLQTWAVTLYERVSESSRTAAHGMAVSVVCPRVIPSMGICPDSGRDLMLMITISNNLLLTWLEFLGKTKWRKIFGLIGCEMLTSQGPKLWQLEFSKVYGVFPHFPFQLLGWHFMGAVTSSVPSQDSSDSELRDPVCFRSSLQTWWLLSGPDAHHFWSMSH